VAEVDTVKTTRSQEELCPDMPYSVIRRLVAVEAGKVP
jgi:hypothetical protein